MWSLCSGHIGVIVQLYSKSLVNKYICKKYDASLNTMLRTTQALTITWVKHRTTRDWNAVRRVLKTYHRFWSKLQSLMNLAKDCALKKRGIWNVFFDQKFYCNLIFCNLWGNNLHLEDVHLKRKRRLRPECRTSPPTCFMYSSSIIYP